MILKGIFPTRLKILRFFAHLHRLLVTLEHGFARFSGSVVGPQFKTDYTASFIAFLGRPMTSSSTLRFPLTKTLLSKLDFQHRWIGTDDHGQPVTEPTPAGVREWYVYDSERRGLYLRVSSSGASWGVRRRLPGDGGRAHALRRKLGDWPTMSVQVARQRAEAWLGLLADGQDPLLMLEATAGQTRQALSEQKQTVGWAFERWMQHMKPTSAAGTHVDRELVKQWMASSPLFARPCRAITMDDIEATFGPMFGYASDQRDPVTKEALYAEPPTWGPQSLQEGGRPLASVWKAYRYAKAAWTWQIQSLLRVEDVSASPFRAWQKGKKWPKPPPRESRLDVRKGDDQAWMRALWAARFEGADTSRVLADLLWLLSLWGTRIDEVAQAQWGDWNREQDLLVVPVERTKTRRGFMVPLTAHTVEVLELRQAHLQRWKRPTGPTDFIFASRVKGQPVKWPYSFLRRLEALGMPKIRPHDLRRGVASDTARMTGQRGGMIVSMMLNHATPGTDVGQVTSDYLADKAEILRPHIEAREAVFLHVLDPARYPKPPEFGAFMGARRATAPAPVKPEGDPLAAALAFLKSNPDAVGGFMQDLYRKDE
ncbi:integrase family protein [Pseudomarimonas arenosa]|uniref:Integrase family protein n=1 Tax=Pseudomarimonas arenosa TaxID=2774145 RepID=A0AAW3ZP45_9GAMM|nr:integrase family protein [Pseudomarimonas arenosa]MBD8527270.1 integrase family protein [Pseudomarimonas arenosa]